MARTLSMTWDPAAGANFSRTAWTNITPPVAGAGVAPTDAMVPPASYGCTWVAGNPQRPNEIWCCVDQLGLWKSTNFGVPGSWTGGQTTPANYGTTTAYLDAPFQIQWNPNDPQHGYCSQGVRGNTQGFWVTFNGGILWTLSAGFLAAATTIGTRDVTAFAVDPTDFNHVILSSHSAWTPLGYSSAGVLEKTGTDTWTLHYPQSDWPSGTQPPHFLFDLATSQGSAGRWHIGTNGKGQFIKAEGSEIWTKVSDVNSVHGGQSLTYIPDGRCIIGGDSVPQISSDNGSTWAAITSLPNGNYFGVWPGGDGYIYTGRTFRNNTYQDPLYRAPVTDPTNFSALSGFTSGDGPEWMTRVGDNFYWVGWTNGLFVKRLG